MLDGISLGSLDGASLDFPDFPEDLEALEPTKGVTLSSASEPASIPAANEEEKSMGIDASSLMVRARIRFLPSFLTLMIRSALAASVAIAMNRRWMGATLILVWMGVLARIRGESSGGIVGDGRS